MKIKHPSCLPPWERKIKQHSCLPPWELDVTCTRCYAILTLEKAEDMFAKAEFTGKMDGIYPDHGPKTYHFICPECGHENRVNAQKIRDDIKAKIKLKR